MASVAKHLVVATLALALFPACRSSSTPATEAAPTVSAPALLPSVPGAHFVCTALVSGDSAGVVVQLINMQAGEGVAELGVQASELSIEGSPGMVLSAHAAAALGKKAGDEVVGLWTGSDGAISNELFMVRRVLEDVGPLAGQDVALVAMGQDAGGCVSARVDGAGVPQLQPPPSDEPVKLPGVELVGQCMVMGATADEQTGLVLAEVAAAAVEGSELLDPLQGGKRCLIGRQLASSLGVELDDKLVLTAFDSYGELASRMVRVGGFIEAEAVVVVDSEHAGCP